MPAAGGVNGLDVAVAVGGPPERGWAALVKTGVPVQVALLGPKAVKVTVPVGVGPPGLPVTLAVSVMDWPRVTVGVAEVTMVGAACSTVVMSAPLPVPMVLSWCVPRAKPTWLVWAPGAGFESWLGTFRTLKVKLIMHW